MTHDDPRHTTQSRTAHTGRPRISLVEWHGITVARYQDGSTKAWHNTLDIATRKGRSEQANPLPLGSTVRCWYLEALDEALRGMRLDSLQDPELPW